MNGPVGAKHFSPWGALIIPPVGVSPGIFAVAWASGRVLPPQTFYWRALERLSRPVHPVGGPFCFPGGLLRLRLLSALGRLYSSLFYGLRLLLGSLGGPSGVPPLRLCTRVFPFSDVGPCCSPVWLVVTPAVGFTPRGEKSPRGVDNCCPTSDRWARCGVKRLCPSTTPWVNRPTGSSLSQNSQP